MYRCNLKSQELKDRSYFCKKKNWLGGRGGGYFNPLQRIKGLNHRRYLKINTKKNRNYIFCNQFPTLKFNYSESVNCKNRICIFNMIKSSKQMIFIQYFKTNKKKNLPICYEPFNFIKILKSSTAKTTTPPVLTSVFTGF